MALSDFGPKDWIALISVIGGLGSVGKLILDRRWKVADENRAVQLSDTEKLRLCEANNTRLQLENTRLKAEGYTVLRRLSKIKERKAAKQDYEQLLDEVLDTPTVEEVLAELEVKQGAK